MQQSKRKIKTVFFFKRIAPKCAFCQAQSMNDFQIDIRSGGLQYSSRLIIVGFSVGAISSKARKWFASEMFAYFLLN